MRSLASCSGLGLAVLLAAGCAAIGGGLGTGGSAGPTPAWELPPPPPEGPITQPGALERFELESGLHALALRDKRIPHVVLGVSVRRGAAIEPVEHAGLAGFTAELMERGAGERDSLALARLVDGMGATLGVGADWDSLTVTVAGLSRDMDALFEVLHDVALAPRFDAEEAGKARAEKLAALERAKDDPATLIRWHAARAVFDGHRYGLPIGGTPQTAAALDEKLARAFHQKLFVASNAIVFAAGDFEHADFERRVRAAFGDWAGGEPPPTAAAPALPAPPSRRVVVVDKPDLGQSRISILHDGIARGDERRTAAGLMNSVFGGSGFSSRLMQRVRAEEGLTYGVYSGFGLRRSPGPFVIDTFTKVPTTRETIDLLLEEAARMQTSPPDAEELAKAKSLQVGSFSLGLETSGRVVSSLVDLDVYGLPDDSLDTFRSRVRAVTEDEVAELAGALLHPERAAIVVLGPAEALVPQLEGLGEIEIVDP